MGFLSYARSAAIVAAGAAALLVAGCSGNNSSSSSGIVNVRTIDDVSNGGNATIEVNNGSVAGSQTYFSISSYHYLQPTNATITLQLSSNTLTYPTTYKQLSGGGYYSVYGIGNIGVTDSSIQGYPEAIALQDDTSGASPGKVLVRFLAAAPDAGLATLTINGTQIASGIAFGNVTGYASFSGATPMVAVTGTSNGGSTAVSLVSKSISLTAGHSYTFLMDEPTIGSGSYSIEVVQDH